MRDTILDEIQPLILDFVRKAQTARTRDEKSGKLRISYANALANLIRAYTALLRDKELDDIQEEIEELKEMYNNRGY